MYVGVSMAVWLAEALSLLLILQCSRGTEGKSSEQSLEKCVEIIVTFYGTEDGKEVLIQVFRQYVGDVKPTKSQPTPNFETCVAKCSEDKKCKEALDNLEMKRSIKSMIRKLLAANLVIKTSMIGGEVFLGYFVGIAADLTQFALHINYAVAGKVVGAVGNVVYGVLLGSAMEAPVMGGGTAFALWVYSEWFSYK